MELLFLWIEDYNNLKKQALNFSAEIRGEVEIELSGIYKLKLSLNPDFAKVYGNPLANVTCIAGENGSGKSSILNALKQIYGNLKRLTKPMFFCHLDHSSNTIFTHFYQGGSNIISVLDVEVEGTEELKSRYMIHPATGYRINRFEENNKVLSGMEINFNHIACAYLSNNLDSTVEKIYEGIINLSTKYRLDSFLDRHIETLTNESKSSSKKEGNISVKELWPTHLREFDKEELRSNIRFLAYAKTNNKGNLPELPRSLSISFNFPEFLSVPNLENKHGQIENDAILNIRSRILDDLGGIGIKNSFKNLIYAGIFFEVLRNILQDKDQAVVKNKKIRDIIEIITNSQENISLSIANNIGAILDLNRTNATSREKIEKLLGKRLIDAIDKAPFESDNTRRRDLMSFSFPIQESVWDLLSLVYDYQYGQEAAFMDYRWDHYLSTGEQARLNNYSRLYEIKHKIHNRFLFLMIDEGDLYYHPQWQKHYMSDLIEGLSFLFPDNQVQLIITTHSPFILSDIPRQNMIFMKREIGADGRMHCEVSQKMQHLETFGANIHELFTDSFFLKDGLMGVYAQNYIDQLIKEIGEEETISNDKYLAHYKKRIDLVGEQFLKAKILELVASKVDVDTIDSIIEARNNEISILKQIADQKRRDKRG